MRFYRLQLRTEGGSSDGFFWFTSKAEAQKAQRLADAGVEDEGDLCDDVEAVDVRPTKAGILRALNVYASHADNG